MKRDRRARACVARRRRAGWPAQCRCLLAGRSTLPPPRRPRSRWSVGVCAGDPETDEPAVEPRRSRSRQVPVGPVAAAPGECRFILARGGPVGRRGERRHRRDRVYGEGVWGARAGASLPRRSGSPAPCRCRPGGRWIAASDHGPPSSVAVSVCTGDPDTVVPE